MLPGFIAIPLMLPGVAYLFVIALIFAFIDGLTHITLANMLILAGITALSFIVDQLAGLLGARWGGARGRTFLYAIAGVVVGNLIMPILGGIIGLFAGIFIGETLRRKELTDVSGTALKAATAGVLGTVAGMIINICLALVFVTLFFVFVL